MSRFVSAGTAEDPPERDDDWLRAQRELDAASERKRQEANGLQDGGKSLFEVLQDNKAAKQEKFEESIRLKNQFRSLDEDEVDFLDSVLESTRAKDEAVRKETTEQLDAFRRQQEEAEKAAREGQTDEVAVEEEEQWHIGSRKRKKAREKESSMKGLKLRKTSSSSATPPSKDADGSARRASSQATQPLAATMAKVVTSKDSTGSPASQKKSVEMSKVSSAAGLGLSGYSSNED